MIFNINGKISCKDTRFSLFFALYVMLIAVFDPFFFISTDRIHSIHGDMIEIHFSSLMTIPMNRNRSIHRVNS
jgi:hypothetical protein